MGGIRKWKEKGGEKRTPESAGERGVREGRIGQRDRERIKKGVKRIPG